jgi:DNA polymerase-3 subunit delta
MSEEILLKELKSGTIRRVYYLHGKESFLVQTYANQIKSAALADGDPLLNLAKFANTPNLSELADFANALPVFAERRVVMLNDLDAEKLDAESLESLIRILSGISESTCVVIYATGFVPDVKKVKTKKLLAAIEGSGKKKSSHTAILSFEKMTEAKIVERIERRASAAGCSISRANAAHLAKLCLRNYTLICSELAKLCAYADYRGEITAKSIDKLTARQLESGVFALAAEITSRRGANAMLLLDELIEQGNAPVMIMSALSSTFIDFYRAKLATAAGKYSPNIVADFAYPPNRSFAVDKAMSAVSRLTAAKIRGCVQVLCDADYKLKSSPASISDKERLIMERAIARLLALC